MSGLCLTSGRQIMSIQKQSRVSKYLAMIYLINIENVILEPFFSLSRRIIL